MRHRSILRASLVAALLAGGAPAFAGPEVPPVEAQTCVDVGCVEAHAGSPAAAGADADVEACGPETVVAACVGGAAGAGTDRVVDAQGAASGHPFTAGCSWSGMPGSRVDFGGTASATPHNGGTITKIGIRCVLYVNGSYWASADGVRWGNTSEAHKRAFPPRGATLRVCLSGAHATWSDGHSIAMASYRCAPDHTGHTA